jgi:peptide/nickel transport system substrate-binding protein
MFRWKSTAAVAALAALVLTGCAAGGSSEPTGDGGSGEGDKLTLVGTLSPTSMDAAVSSWGNAAPFYQAVYDTLLLATPDGTIEPFLASEWSYNEDNTELTLTLRDDVTFSDGSALTSEVVKTNLERFKAGTSPDASFLRNLDTVETPDETTAVLKLSAPDPGMLSYLTRDPGLIASGEAIESDVDGLATNPIGSGPYILDTTQTVTGTSYVYSKNDDYWNPDVQHYEELVINVIPDPTAALNAIKSGEANGVRLANNQNLGEIEAAGWTINAGEINQFGLLLLDRAGTLNPALGEVKVRQAINHAFDREALLTALQKDAGVVNEQTFPPRSAAYDEALEDTYPYDPEKAKELLAEAGYPDGFTLEMPSTASVGPTTFNLITQQLADVGITATFVDAGNNYVSDMLAAKYAAAYIGLEQTGDWQITQFMIAPTATFNPFHYEDETVNALLEEMQYGDQAAQDKAAAELNKYILDQAWFAWWYRPQNSYATDPNTSVEMIPTNNYPAIYDFQPMN